MAFCAEKSITPIFCLLQAEERILLRMKKVSSSVSLKKLFSALLMMKKKPYSGELHSWNGGHQLCGTSPNEVRGFTKNLPLIILIKSCYDGEVVWGHGGHILQPLWPKCQLCAASLFEVEAEAKNVPHPTKMKSHLGGEAVRGCGGCWEH